MNFLKICLFSWVLFLGQAVAFDYYSEFDSFPSSKELLKLKNNGQVAISICCSYPSKEQLNTLKTFKISIVKFRVGHFPSDLEMEALNSYQGSYSLEMSEVFPSKRDHKLINNSKITQLTINSRDFLTKGEAIAINGFGKNVRININHPEYPLPRHMRILKLLKKTFTVSFRNRVAPGIGYANFFNDLQTKKIFRIVNEYPYGEDYIGVNALTNSSLEFLMDDFLTELDVEQFNKMKIGKKLMLGNQLPYNNDKIELINSIEGSQVYLGTYGLTPMLLDLLKKAKSTIILMD